MHSYNHCSMIRDKRILLVEDDIIDMKTIQRILKKNLQLENELVMCKNGEEALKWLNQNEQDLPGLILLDLNMPRMNGLELLQIIKQHQLYKLIPTVILTTSADPSDRLRSYDLNVAGYMLKSVDHNQFIEKISSIKKYWEHSELAY